MKLQFVFGTDAENTIDIDVSEVPTMENSLINTIKEDCQRWENLEQNKFYNYMHLNECKNSKESGLYQLILNGKELWYGTLSEINAVVKTMIMRIERDFTI